MVLITIVDGVYKPTYNWGAPHCIDHRTRRSGEYNENPQPG